MQKSNYFSLSMFVILVLVFSEGQSAPRPPLLPEQVEALKLSLQQVPLSRPVIRKTKAIRNNCIYETWSLEVMDVSTSQFHQVQVDYAKPDKAGSFPFAVIVPTIAGKTPVEGRIQNELCRGNMSSAIVKMEKQLVPDVMPGWEGQDQQMRFAVHSVRSVLDFAETLEEVDPEQMVAFGGSLGGIVISLVAIVEPRIKATMILAAGGNLPEILARTDHQDLIELREKRMSFLRLGTPEAYEQEAQKHIFLDPVLLADESRKDSISMVIVKEDEKVSSAGQLELWEKFGRPERIDKKSGHVRSILTFAMFQADEVVKFFRRKLLL